MSLFPIIVGANEERKIQAKKNQFFGIPGNGGYRAPKKLPDKDPLTDGLDEEALEVLQQCQLKAIQKAEKAKADKEKALQKAEKAKAEKEMALQKAQKAKDKEKARKKAKEKKKESQENLARKTKAPEKKRPVLLKNVTNIVHQEFEDQYTNPIPGSSTGILDHSANMKKLAELQRRMDESISPTKMDALERRLSGEKLVFSNQKKPKKGKTVAPRTPYQDRPKRNRKATAKKAQQ